MTGPREIRTDGWLPGVAEMAGTIARIEARGISLSEAVAVGLLEMGQRHDDARDGQTEDGEGELTTIGRFVAAFETAKKPGVSDARRKRLSGLAGV